jgi:hypothetical protein
VVTLVTLHFVIMEQCSGTATSSSHHANAHARTHTHISVPIGKGHLLYKPGNVISRVNNLTEEKSCICTVRSRDSAVGIATGYGLDDKLKKIHVQIGLASFMD